MTTTSSLAEPRTLTREEEAALKEVRSVMVRGLLARGIPLVDVEDAAQNGLLFVFTHVDRFENALTDVDGNRGLFVRTAWFQYHTTWRSELARRNREERYAASTLWSNVEAQEDEWVTYVLGFEQLTLFDLPAATRLTPTQRSYLRMVFDLEMSISDIAQHVGTSTSAVSRVLRRAIIALQGG
jgi:RNA polymerase sigma factor (sigma-70 family)